MRRGQILERESQLAALTSYAEEARAGAGRMALISGEAGIGKSTVVEQLEAGLAAATWWWGACDGLSTPRALGPLADIATQTGGELLRAWRDGASRDARFDALLALLREGSELGVLVIEDLHWADEATLDMLRFIGRRIRDAHVLVIVTYRDDALDPDEPLRATLGDLATHRSTRRVALGPLSEQAIGVLAADSDVDAGVLYRLTGGSPFFATEVLASGGEGVPRSARDVVLARAAALTADQRSVLDHAALIGTHIDPGLLAEASGASAASLDVLVGSGMLVDDAGGLRFRHEIARQAVQAEVAPHRAVELHRAILHALIAGGSGDDARLAFHADAARDSPRALEHARRAARTAAAMASHREAAAQLERAVSHAQTADVAARADLHDELADELALVERWDDAATIRQTAIELWHEAGNRLREGAAQSRFAVVMWRLCRGPEMIAADRRARELLEPLGATAELAELYSTGADAADPDTTVAYITRAAELAAELDLPKLRVTTLNGLAYLAACQPGGDYETPLREALDIALKLDLQQHAGRSYANLTEYYANDSRLAQAEPLFLEALTYCEEHDVATFGNCVRGHYAMALLDQGRWDEALRAARTVLDTNASPINRLTSLLTSGLVHARRGQPSDEAFLDEANEIATGVGEVQYIAMARLALTEAHWLAGADDEVKQTAVVIAWERRLGVHGDDVPVSGPYAVQVLGPPRRAAQNWDALGMPFHAALALGDSSDETDLREAVSRLEPLSPPAARIVRRRMRDLGLRAIPVGARATTRSDPNGLTRREREVLDLLQERLTDEQIADRLVISVKTVNHHVCAVLAKLGIASRRDVPVLARV
jgi:DNA-binding CsgD family transcriptional regulator/tetratricopeptide (TPR) repeat protein